MDAEKFNLINRNSSAAITISPKNLKVSMEVSTFDTSQNQDQDFRDFWESINREKTCQKQDPGLNPFELA
jgi:hypothetical protein